MQLLIIQWAAERGGEFTMAEFEEAAPGLELRNHAEPVPDCPICQAVPKFAEECGKRDAERLIKETGKQ